ncbi:hypothetical protein OEZ85_005528 [Tetradesmus obliquus]|uniref:Uncharacterized protein n=1 Tax=Tetradesmus obliquus TaxID=3088 RepID=A0ABY8UDZ3_TETOB|nr:hypothetical protein OEZ85_005528 [Tetradesmus obliquus]
MAAHSKAGSKGRLIGAAVQIDGACLSFREGGRLAHSSNGHAGGSSSGVLPLLQAMWPVIRPSLELRPSLTATAQCCMSTAVIRMHWATGSQTHQLCSDATHSCWMPKQLATLR